MKDATRTAFAAAGKSASVPARVAFAGSDTCRSCHDAGLKNAVGVIVQSWPHFTPGYFHFVKSAAHEGAAMTNAPPIPDLLAATNSAGIAAVQAWLNDPVNYEERYDRRRTASASSVTSMRLMRAGVGKTY